MEVDRSYGIISRDILLLSRVDKPALLRQLFRLGCDYSGQILAYNKMLGQLHDAGNTTTLAHWRRRTRFTSRCLAEANTVHLPVPGT